jgi:hypothetical protein
LCQRLSFVPSCIRCQVPAQGATVPSDGVCADSFRYDCITCDNTCLCQVSENSQGYISGIASCVAIVQTRRSGRFPLPSSLRFTIPSSLTFCAKLGEEALVNLLMQACIGIEPRERCENQKSHSKIHLRGRLLPTTSGPTTHMCGLA